MRAPISVIIPTLNAQEALPSCLAAAFEGVNSGLIRELIVVDGGSQDNTVQIAKEAGADVFSRAASRGGQLQLGGQVAKGTWLLFLHADTQLEAGWSDVVAAHMAKRHQAAYFRLRFDQSGFPGRFVAGWANFRSRLFGLPYGDQGLLISRDVYEFVGGYEDIPLMEDVAIARALKGNLKPLQALAVTNAEKYRSEGWLRRGARNLKLLLRYFSGASPATLADEYRR